MLEVDLDDATPIYLQIARGLKRAIARGEAVVGQRLPSVRQLAGDLAVNLNTVARAYRHLEDEGLLRVRQGRGARVVSDQVSGDGAHARDALGRALSQAFTQARLEGLSRVEVEEIVGQSLDLFDGRGRGEVTKWTG